MEKINTKKAKVNGTTDKDANDLQDNPKDNIDFDLEQYHILDFNATNPEGPMLDANGNIVQNVSNPIRLNLLVFE
jgi:hypothetical protein